MANHVWALVETRSNCLGRGGGAACDECRPLSLGYGLEGGVISHSAFTTVTNKTLPLFISRRREVFNCTEIGVWIMTAALSLSLSLVPYCIISVRYV